MFFRHYIIISLFDCWTLERVFPTISFFRSCDRWGASPKKRERTKRKTKILAHFFFHWKPRDARRITVRNKSRVEEKKQQLWTTTLNLFNLQKFSSPSPRPPIGVKRTCITLHLGWKGNEKENTTSLCALKYFLFALLGKNNMRPFFIFYNTIFFKKNVGSLAKWAWNSLNILIPRYTSHASSV